MAEQCAKRLKLKRCNSDVVISSVSGEWIKHAGQVECNLVVQEFQLTAWKALVVPQLPGDASLLIGMDVIQKVGGLTLSIIANGQVSAQLGPRKLDVAAAVSPPKSITPSMVLEDVDFRAEFNGQVWEVEWKWKKNPPLLTNQVAQYAIKDNDRDAYNAEVARWIKEGWLKPCDQPKSGIIPMLAVRQEVKNKVRPVMDFRELNIFIQSHTAECEVCPETLRKWRLMGNQLGIVDLKNAYLQLHVRRDLQEFQVVRVGEQHYRLTRLGFGLASAPKIMSAVVKCILNADPDISAATDHYVDDIVINTDMVSVNKVVEHLQRYGLETKPPETLDGARVLGLHLAIKQQGGLTWTRGKAVPQLLDKPLTRRELFSICGRLIGHYPVAGWLRIACSFIKRHSEGQKWDDTVGERVTVWLRQVLERVSQADPVQGRWAVPRVDEGRVWCDASSLATGVVLQIGEVIAEDAAWLRKKHDAAHINVAELDSMIQGLNMAIRWCLKTVTVVTDSATVHSWLTSVLTGSHRVRSSGLSEMLIKRRLFMVAELIEAYGLTVVVTQVPSAGNKADILTRVPRSWLQELNLTKAQVCAVTRIALEQQHQKHHFGVERTLHLARQVDPEITRSEVERVVKECARCNSIDPAPVKWNSGHLYVDSCWERIAIDITHYQRNKFLSVIDCGPSRYTIWRKINAEDAATVVASLESIFIELGPPVEILLDNSTTFRSDQMQQLCSKWAVRLRFRCAYRPSGNGIVERIHRTVKRVAARANISPPEAAFWYNLAPSNHTAESAPSTVLFNSGYKWRNPSAKVPDRAPPSDDNERFHIGDTVFVKPAAARCTTRWPTGRVTAILSGQAIEVDGVPRHVADCRSV